MDWVHPKSCALYSTREVLQSIITKKVPPLILTHIVSSSSCLWDLGPGLCLGAFPVPVIYVETYTYDDVYVRILMESYFCASNHIVR